MTTPAAPIKCSAPGCFLRLKPGMVFCTAHWNALPVTLRDGIYAAQHKPEKYAGARVAAVQWLAQRSQAITRSQTTMPNFESKGLAGAADQAKREGQDFVQAVTTQHGAIDTDTFVEKVACIAHETNRAYCLAIGDNAQMGWNDAPPWQRNSIIAGVRFTILNPTAGPAASHASWLAEKRADGWAYGPKKDPVAKVHPCFVPYDQLPPEQRAKDYIFQAVVRTVVAMFRETP